MNTKGKTNDNKKKINNFNIDNSLSKKNSSQDQECRQENKIFNKNLEKKIHNLNLENQNLYKELKKIKNINTERINDLKRLKAEFINYKKRIERDRLMTKDLILFDVFHSLLSVLDDIDAAKKHGDLQDGPFYSISQKLQSILFNKGLVKYEKSEIGKEFDPSIHEAVYKTASCIPSIKNKDKKNNFAPKGQIINKKLNISDCTNIDVVDKVLRAGYKLKDKIIRAAQVSILIYQEDS